MNKVLIMKSSQIPPYVVMGASREVIFLLPKQFKVAKKISGWLKELNLSNYNGMVINSKCIFKRLKDQECK